MLCALLFVSSQCYSAAFFVLNSDVFSEPEPLQATAENWGQAFGAGERQWLVSNAELGVRYRGVELSVEQRALADVRINREAAVFFGKLSRQEALEPGKTVPVHVDVNGFTAQGLRLGYRYESLRWTLGASVARLQASHLMSGSLDGGFTATTMHDFDFDATVDYYYYRDPIFKRPNVREPEGEGWSVRVAGDWQINPYVHIAVEADDLLATIDWHQAPFTQAQALTDRKRYDADGYAIFDPFLSGVEGYASTYHQKLDPRYAASAALGPGPWTAHLHARHQFGFDLVGYGVGSVLNGLQLRASYWPKLDALGVELGWRRLMLGITLDDVVADDIQFISVNLSLGY